ncbi:Protein of unknown function [Natronincola peptidivorans]|uniref:DUF2922 domain-containing protein n=1 Tax=Natronincola peptidivorans TaxID=426128 RepID=A0A1I0EKK3_9FIRM|nr:DUF2922 domain-containing protein [Natronincola peptidivorans]SET45974.1 Protein of unknown function [Natronincola peptidivorans]
MNRRLRLLFKTTGDRIVALNIADPKDTLEASEVQSVMQTIIDENAVITSSGELYEIHSAYIIETTTDTLIEAV